MLQTIARRRLVELTLAALCATTVVAQSTAPSIAPLRTSPAEKFTVNPGFRDWAPAVVAGTTIVAGNSSGRGGLYAVDTVSGKLKWTARPVGLPGNPFVATRPVIAGNLVIAPMANSLMAVTLATGKEAWRGPRTEIKAAVAADATTAFVMGEDRVFHAVDAATGKPKWTMPFARSGSCEAVPVVHDGTVYVSAAILVSAADANRSASYYTHLFAIDAATGQERWRYPSAPIPGNNRGVCLEQPVVSGGTLFGTVSATLHAVDLATGKDRWAPVEIRRPVEGRERAVELGGLVDAGSVLAGLTSGFLIGFDKATGKTAWEVKGQYRITSPATAVAGNVLYFQGHPGAEPASEVQGRIVYQGGKPVPTVPVLPGGRLNAMDLQTREILWSFSRPTVEPNWPFGFVTPVEGGLWVDSYQALVKLQ